MWGGDPRRETEWARGAVRGSSARRRSTAVTGGPDPELEKRMAAVREREEKLAEKELVRRTRARSHARPRLALAHHRSRTRADHAHAVRARARKGRGGGSGWSLESAGSMASGASMSRDPRNPLTPRSSLRARRARAWCWWCGAASEARARVSQSLLNQARILDSRSGPRRPSDEPTVTSAGAPSPLPPPPPAAAAAAAAGRVALRRSGVGAARQAQDWSNCGQTAAAV